MLGIFAIAELVKILDFLFKLSKCEKKSERVTFISIKYRAKIYIFGKLLKNGCHMLIFVKINIYFRTLTSFLTLLKSSLAT